MDIKFLNFIISFIFPLNWLNILQLINDILNMHDQRSLFYKNILLIYVNLPYILLVQFLL